METCCNTRKVDDLAFFSCVNDLEAANEIYRSNVCSVKVAHWTLTPETWVRFPAHDLNIFLKFF